MSQLNLDSISLKSGGGYIDIVNMFMPVGIIISLTSTTNPNTLYPGTTWVRIKGRMIVGVDESDTSINSAAKTGGEKTHTLTKQEMPKHQHTDSDCTYHDNASGWTKSTLVDTGSTGRWLSTHSFNNTLPIGTGFEGGGAAHNNMPPYYAAYMWRRTA